MIVVAVEDRCQLGVRILRLPAVDVAVAAAQIKHARGGQPLGRHVTEEIAQPMQMRRGHGIVGHVAEVLRRVVMSHVALVRGLALRVVAFVVVTLLIPAPVDRSHAVPGDLFDVLSHIGQIEGRIIIGCCRLA